MMIGAILAGASKEEIETIARVAADVGLAFQIQDDILDVISTNQELGKPTGSDERNHKTTYVAVQGLEKAKTDVAAISERAIRTLASLPQKNDFLEELIGALVTRRN